MATKQRFPVGALPKAAQTALNALPAAARSALIAEARNMATTVTDDDGIDDGSPWPDAIGALLTDYRAAHPLTTAGARTSVSAPVPPITTPDGVTLGLRAPASVPKKRADGTPYLQAYGPSLRIEATDMRPATHTLSVWSAILSAAQSGRLERAVNRLRAMDAEYRSTRGASSTSSEVEYLETF
jgi:hypothetical protein